MTNVRIKAVDVYHAKKQVDNDVYLEHFKKQGKDITNFLNIMGRKKRYVIDNPKENTITMAIEATNQVLKKAGLKGKDIDMIVFSTQVPEVTVPTNAMFILSLIHI